MKINDKYGYWENDTTEGHGTDAGLAWGLVKFFDREQVHSIYDFGCGDGYYTRSLYDAGFHILGYDGNPNTPKITNGLCEVANLALPLLLKPRDWVMCLEVAEHIPEEFEKVFISNIDKNCIRGVIISWAIPGQGGDGHVNCKSNLYVDTKFRELGFSLDLDSTEFLRNSCNSYPTPCYWFSETIMIFRRDKKDV